MKKGIVSLVALLLPLSLANATTVTLSSSPFGPLVNDSDGNNVGSGNVILVGTFSDPTNADLDTALASFMEFGTATTVAIGPNDGRIAGVITDTTAAADAFNGQDIYLWVYNSATVAASTEYGVFRAETPAGAEWTFPTNAGGVGDSVTISIADINTNPIIPGTSITPGANDPTGSTILTLVPIPEPSAALLFSIATIGFLFRRKK